MSKISQKEYNKVIKLVEKNTCFRFSAGLTNSGAFMTPVAKDGQILGGPIEFTWKQLKEMSKLRHP